MTEKLSAKEALANAQAALSGLDARYQDQIVRGEFSWYEDYQIDVLDVKDALDDFLSVLLDVMRENGDTDD